MIIEILGAKMLAPYVGTSHFVWTAQIAVTLVALAAGYYFGGRLADRAARLNRLYNCILLAAIYLAASIAIIEPLAYWCLQFRLAVGSLLASTCLFFIPLSLLAVTGPFLVRTLTSSLQNVGANTGRLIAVSTVGSFVGTILIGYVLVPFLRNSVTMFLTAIILLVLVIGYFAVWHRRGRGPAAVMTGVLIALLTGAAGVRREYAQQYSGWTEIVRRNSNFGLLQVIQNNTGTRRFYLNDFLTQNTYDPESKQSLSLFTYMLHDLARAYTPRVERALCIGLGVGIVPMQFAREGVQTDVIEINPAVAPVAARYFEFQPGQVHLEIGDGRSFLNRAPAARYDTAILDAFLGDSSPSHLMSRQAFASFRRVLKPEGTLVINCFGDFDEGRDFLVASLEKTLRAVFATVHIHAIGSGNVFFVASQRPQLEILHPPDFARVHPNLRTTAERTFGELRTTNPQHGIVLTDDYNPIEFYDAANRESWRRQMALSMKSL